MAISRVQKFKDYRNSLIKEETPTLETPKSEPVNDNDDDRAMTTSTLPMDQVIKSVNKIDQEEAFARIKRRETIIAICIIAGLATLVIAGIIVFAILVWR